MAEFIIKNFKGIITRVEKESIPVGSASNALNWLNQGDHIELRRGQQTLGTENSGAGKITGMKTGVRFDGVEVPWRTRGRKIEYFDVDTEDWIEAGTNVIASDADDEDISIDDYYSLAGAFMYFSSPNSSIYKIPIANPGDVVNQNSTSHKGKIKIKQNRMFLWDRKDTNGGSDKTGLYGSYIDKDELSDYTEVTAENVGTGDASETNFTGTLAERTGVRTVMYVRITDSVETFTDDRSGTLVGNQGGTGTINYATGAFDITFNTAPAGAQAITADYFYEDATSEGIVDFSKDSPRTAAQGFTFRQDDGGSDFQAMGSIGDAEFCLHTLKTWRLTLTSDDTNATNLIYRNKVGIEFFRGFAESGEGIYYVDSSDQSDPFIRLLRFSDASSEILPFSMSDEIKLGDFRFDKSVVFEFEPYIVIACRTKDNTINDRILFYNKIWKSWDITDYRASTLEKYNGTLIAGDSGSNNVSTLFSSVADEDSEIVNFWISGNYDLGFSGTKRVNRLVLTGLIARGQSMKVSISLDDGNFIEVLELDGNGSYVDAGSSISVGSSTVGLNSVGGGTDVITANRYRIETNINTDTFSEIRIRFEALGVGFVSVSEIIYKDIRLKGRRISNKYLSIN